MSNRFNYLFTIIATVLFMIGCTGNQQTKAPTTAKEIKTHGQSGVSDPDSKKNILQIAVGSKDHSTLVAACKAAGIADVLVNPGPLTVFAPVNAAFDKLPKGTVETLLKPENKDKLATILKYHAAPGTFAGIVLKNTKNIYMATGHYLKVERKGKDTYVNGSKILATVKASNGIVHVIDNVFLPPSDKKKKSKK